MLNASARRLMAFYLANAAAALHHRDREASDLAEWIADRENRVAFGRRKRPSPIRAGKRGRDEGMSGGNWRSLKEALREEYSAARKARPDRTAQRLRRLAKTTGLTRRDIDLLELVLRYQTQPVIESMIDDVFRAPRRFMTPLNVQGPALPALLGVSANTVQARLRADAPLVRSGLVAVDSDGDLKALDRLNRLAAAPAGSGTDVHRLLQAAPTPTLRTMNSTRGVSETILRRMMFALELRRPTPRVRARIWARELARRGIEASSVDVLSLAREFEATPGVGAGATAAAGLAGGGIDAVRHGVWSSESSPPSSAPCCAPNHASASNPISRRSCRPRASQCARARGPGSTRVCSPRCERRSRPAAWWNSGTSPSQPASKAARESGPWGSSTETARSSSRRANGARSRGFGALRT